MPTRRYRDDFERPTTPPRYYNNFNRRSQNNTSQNRGRLYYRGTGRVFYDSTDGCSRCGLIHGASCPALSIAVGVVISVCIVAARVDVFTTFIARTDSYLDCHQ